MGWQWGVTACPSTPSVAGYSPDTGARAGWLLPMIRTFTPLFMLPCRRWSRFANGEDAKLRFNLSKVKIYILGISRERARELVRQNIERDPSLRVFANSTIWILWNRTLVSLT